MQFLGSYDHDGSAKIWVEVGSDDRAVGVIGGDDHRLAGVFARALPRAIARGRRLLTQGAGFSESQDWARGLVERMHVPGLLKLTRFGVLREAHERRPTGPP